MASEAALKAAREIESKYKGRLSEKYLVETAQNEADQFADKVLKLAAERDEAVTSLVIIERSAQELVALLKDKFGCPDMDALTLFFTSVLVGIAERWAADPPKNGFIHVSTFPNVGQLEIQIRSIKGKSATESLKENEVRIRDLERTNAELLAALLLIRGSASQLLYRYEGTPETKNREGYWRNLREAIAAAPVQITKCGE